MQHQVHVLSVFDRISLVLGFCPSDRLDTKAGQLSTSSSGHCHVHAVEFLLQHNNNTNLAFQCQKHIVGPPNW